MTVDQEPADPGRPKMVELNPGVHLGPLVGERGPALRRSERSKPRAADPGHSTGGEGRLPLDLALRLHHALGAHPCTWDGHFVADCPAVGAVVTVVRQYDLEHDAERVEAAHQRIHARRATACLLHRPVSRGSLHLRSTCPELDDARAALGVEA